MLSVHSCPTGPLGSKDTGGMSVYIRELAREIGKRAHTVDIYTRTHDFRDPQLVEVGANARVIHLRAGPDETAKSALFHYLPDFADNLESYRRENGLDYDLIFSHYWLSGWVGEWLAQSWNVPHAVMFHTLGAIKKSLGIGEDEPALRLQTEACLAKSCHIIAATPRERDFLRQQYGARKISVYPCGVNLELFQPLDKAVSRQRLKLNHPKVVLYVGRIEPLKGIDQLLRAVPLMQARPRLVIIGGDKNSQDEVNRLKLLSRQLGMGPDVTFLGLIKQEELPLYYSAADVCVIPSYYESFGLVALEALACGTPVIANNVGDLSHIIRDGRSGYILPDNSPSGLAHKIEAVLSGEGPANSSAIRASVLRFAWSNVAEGIIGKFQRLLDKSAVPVC